MPQRARRGGLDAGPAQRRAARPRRHGGTRRRSARDDAVFKAALQAIRLLAECVGEELAPHLGVLLVQISKKSFQAKFKASIVVWPQWELRGSMCGGRVLYV